MDADGFFFRLNVRVGLPASIRRNAEGPAVVEQHQRSVKAFLFFFFFCSNPNWCLIALGRIKPDLNPNAPSGTCSSSTSPIVQAND